MDAIAGGITASLKSYFPQVLDWFEDKDTGVFCAFIEQFPTVQAAQAVTPAALTAFFWSHHAGRRSAIHRRIQPNSRCWSTPDLRCGDCRAGSSADAGADEQKQASKSHQQSIRALAYKWGGILWRCWQDRTPYDEAKYLAALERRQSPLVKRLVAVNLNATRSLEIDKASG